MAKTHTKTAETIIIYLPSNILYVCVCTLPGAPAFCNMICFMGNLDTAKEMGRESWSCVGEGGREGGRKLLKKEIVVCIT